MAHEINTQTSKFLQSKHQMPDTPCKTIEAPDQDNMEFPTANVTHECLQAWPGLFGAAHPVGVNAKDAPSALLDQRLQGLELDFWILQWGRDSTILLDPRGRATDIDRRSGFREVGTGAKVTGKLTLFAAPEKCFAKGFQLLGGSKPAFGGSEALGLRSFSKKG